MSFLNKFLGEQERHPAHPAARLREVAAGAATSVMGQAVLRPSNSLKDFLSHLSDVENGRLLDLGSISQSTVNFFITRGFKIYSEDLLRGWREHLAAEEKRLLEAQVGGAAPPHEFAMAAITERFLQSSMGYSRGSFHAALLWDLCDYLDSEAVAPMITRVLELLRPGGVMLGFFNSRKPDSFFRYRVRDAEYIELLPARPLFSQVRVLQNRDLLNIFGGFKTSKTYVGRDHLREAIFIK